MAPMNDQAPPPAGLPKLRSDLVVSRQETAEGVFFVLKDPRTGRFLRFREPEYAILRRLDGATALDDVARAVAQEFEVELDAQTLQPFVEQVRRRSLLEDPSGALPPAATGAIRGNLLWLRLRAIDPDRFFDWLMPKVRFFFTPQFVVTAIALIVWAVGTTVLSAGEITGDLARLWTFQNLVFAWVTMLSVTTLHEFAHGLTCKHYGGKVHEIGFLLIYLQPAFYCNISDAWLFPEKRKRLWVTAAGAFFELFLWAGAVLMWRLMERGTWVSDAALIVIATSGLKQFFNLNPLIKLDGYYLLSDLLDMPNLRQRAFGYLFARIKRLLWGRAAVPELPAATPRERRIFFGYGTLAVTFSYWLLGNILLGLSGWLTQTYHAWGFAMATVLTALVVGSVIGKPILPSPLKLWKPGRRAKLAILGGAMLVLLIVLRLT